MERVLRTLFVLVVCCGIGLLALHIPVAAGQTDDSAAWFSDSVLYEVFVRSFRDADGDGIGDLRGVMEGLDYIQSLGADTIWLMPIFETTTYHGYDTVDYYAINPDYGSNEDFLALLDAAHERDMRIIIDYVINHTSDQHPFFQDAYGNPESEYAEFYRWTNDAHTQYDSFGGHDYLPRLNYDSQAVRDYVIDVALHWMDPDGDGDPVDGVDGFRADVATGPSLEFWAEWRDALKALEPDVLLLGEVWRRNADELSPYFDNRFDALFDFPVYHTIGGHHDNNEDSVGSGHMPTNDLRLQFRVAPTYYPPNVHLVRFANNHDTNRIASDAGEDEARMRAVAVWLMTAPGTPMLYYGDEIGMRGVKGRGPYYDEFRREPMDWYANADGDGMTDWFSGMEYTLPDDGVSVEEQDGDPESLLSLYRTLGALRQEHGALRGEYDAPRITFSIADLWVVWRWDDDEVALIVVNFGQDDVEYDPLGQRTPVEFDADSLTVLLEEGLGQGEEAPLFSPGAFWVGRWAR